MCTCNNKNKLKINIVKICLCFLSIISIYLTTKNHLMFSNGLVNTFVLLVSLVFLGFNSIRYIKKAEHKSIFYLAVADIVALLFILRAYTMIADSNYIIVRAFLFIILVVIGLWIVWEAKKIKKKFILYLVVSLLTVIIGFAGVYQAIYFEYFPYDQEALKIEQEMSYEQVIMPLDFIYYSADNLFGTDISDVRINYIDDTEYLEDNSVKARHVNKNAGAKFAIQLIKIFALGESLLFIIYISIIVLGVDD